MNYKDYSTALLTFELRRISAKIFNAIDYGEPVENYRDEIKELVRGTIELWMRSMKK